MASVIGHSNGSVAEANYQASPPNQCGKTHSQSLTPTTKGAATLINRACPAVTKPQKELSNWTNGGLPPTVKIPIKDGTSQEVTMNMDGLKPPTFDSTKDLVTGAETEQLQLQNRKQRHALQDNQDPTSMWTTHRGSASLPPKTTLPPKYLNKMCLQGLTTSHPAGELLAEWSQLGCPTRTGWPWLKMKMWEAIERGPHQSSLSPKAIAHFKAKSKEKVMAGQVQIVVWDDIKDDPPPQLKVSPIAAIPHKSKDF